MENASCLPVRLPSLAGKIQWPEPLLSLCGRGILDNQVFPEVSGMNHVWLMHQSLACVSSMHDRHWGRMTADEGRDGTDLEMGHKGEQPVWVSN